MYDGVRVLGFEDVGRDEEYSFFRCEFSDFDSDGIDEVRFSHAAGSVEEEGVEGRFSGVVGDTESHASRESVADALDEVLKRVAHVQLRVQRRQSSLVNALLRVSREDWCSRFFGEGRVFCGEFVAQSHLLAKVSDECFLQHLGIVSVHVFGKESAGHSQCQFVGLEADELHGFKPGSEVLLRDLLTDELQTTLPILGVGHAWKNLLSRC